MSLFTDRTVVIITGPTAVGKSAVAVELAKHFQTEIISADSRQCFKELNIGVARPSDEELLEVPHHFIASHSIREDISAITFEKYALQKAEVLFQQHARVIMAGGTGLYINAFCEGLDLIPGIDSAIREEIIQSYQKNGIDWLKQQLLEKDPLFSQTGEMQNPQRMMRALEVMQSTGQSVLSFHKGEKVKRDFNIIKIGLELPMELLKRNIQKRVDAMMESGLLEEVKQLSAYQHLNALHTVGYAELFDFIDGKISLQKAVEKIKTHTRQYAKRQFTWLRKDKEVNWFSPGQVKEIIEFVTSAKSG